MTPAEQYRTLAAKIRANARVLDSATNHAVEWEHLAACYDRLAEQAERNERFDLTYEPILRPDGGPEGEPAEQLIQNGHRLS